LLIEFEVFAYKVITFRYFSVKSAQSGLGFVGDDGAEEDWLTLGEGGAWSTCG